MAARFFEWFGFYRCAGLDSALHADIAASDVLVYLVPHRLRSAATMRESADVLVAAFLAQNGLSPMLRRLSGFCIVYGVMLPRPRTLGPVASWQEWELQTAKALEIPFVKISLEETTPGQDSDVRSHLEADFRAMVLPDIVSVRRPDPSIAAGPLPPAIMAFCGGLCLFAAEVGLAIGVAMVVHFFAVRAIF